MINLTATLIQKQLRTAQSEGLLTGAFYVSSETDLSTGKVIIEFDKDDANAVFKLISQAIIYGEIAPADADRAVAARKYRKRLENGTASNQMYSKLIDKLYGKGIFSDVFEAEKEILLDTDYTKILSSYPPMLNAQRYSLIVCGAVPENLQTILEESFGQFAAQKSQAATQEETKSSTPLPDFTAAKNIQVSVRHTFLTDIPAEKAGPQPAVLIPTTEFLDPVIYAGQAPQPGTKEAALYNALLNYTGTELAKNNPVTIQLPKNSINIGSLIIQNVAHTRELDAQYKSLIQKTTEELQRLQANENIVRKIKNCWIQKQLNQTNSDTGTALLMQKGLELFGPQSDTAAQWYLQEYNYILQASSQDYLEAMSWFPIIPAARVYSIDSKK